MRPDLGTPPEPDYTPAAAPGWIKPVAIVAVLVLLGAGLSTWKSHWSGPSGDWEYDFDAGLDRAQSLRKPMLVLYTADWCPPCQELKRTVLGNPLVMEPLKERYVLVKVDLTDRTSFNPNIALAAQYEIAGIPTVILYDSDGEEVDRVVGGGPTLANWFYRKAGR